MKFICTKFYKLLFVVVLINLLVIKFDAIAELRVTSKDPNFGASQSSDFEFTKTWLCENIGSTNLNVTLTSQKTGRTPSAWGLDNIAENFNLQAGGTQNCGIKLTTSGEKGIGDVSAKISTEGFERNVNMTFYTDVFKNIFVNASNEQDIKTTELFKYISQKYADYSEFNQNDFINLSGLTQTADFYFYIGGSDTEIDSLTAEKLVDAFLSGKSVFICGSEPLYTLSKTHPEHRIWSFFGFSISEEVIFDELNKNFSLQMVNMVEMNSVGDNTFNLLDGNKPIRAINLDMGGQLSIDKVLWIDGESNKYVGFVKKNFENNSRIIFINVDLYGHKLNDEFPQFTTGFYYSLFFENGTSIRNNKRNSENNLIMYPNPINNDNNILNWKTNDLHNIEKQIENYDNLLSYEIYDLNGNLITKNHNTNQYNLNINTDKLPKGTFTIKLVFENQIVTKKIVRN